MLLLLANRPFLFGPGNHEVHQWWTSEKSYLQVMWKLLFLWYICQSAIWNWHLKKKSLFSKSIKYYSCQQYGSDLKCGIHIAVVLKHQLMCCYINMDQRSLDAVKTVFFFLHTVNRKKCYQLIASHINHYLYFLLHCFVYCQICFYVDSYTFSLMPIDYRWKTLFILAAYLFAWPVYELDFVRCGRGQSHWRWLPSAKALLIRDRVMRAR